MNFIERGKQHKKNFIVRAKKEGNIIHIIVWSIALISIAILLSKIIPESKLAKENIQQNEIIKIMAQIDDIAHQHDKMLHEIGTWYSENRDRIFHIADNNYHKAQYRDEKYTAAIKLNQLIKEQNEFLHDLVGDNPFAKAEKEKFEQLQKKIEEIQTMEKK